MIVKLFDIIEHSFDRCGGELRVEASQVGKLIGQMHEAAGSFNLIRENTMGIGHWAEVAAANPWAEWVKDNLIDLNELPEREQEDEGAAHGRGRLTDG